MAVARAGRGRVVRERGAERNTDVLDQMVLEIPRRLERKIETRIPRERDHHVVEKAETRRDGCTTVTVVDLEPDTCLRGLALDNAHWENSSAACHGSIAPV